MPNFIFNDTGIEGLILIEPVIHGDERGFFMETYNRREFETAGITAEFVQDNHSKSRKGVLRGLHFQIHNPQGKLVRAISGEVFDVAVDLRKNSPSYGQWRGFELSSDNKLMLYVPEGFAHGFLVTSMEAEFVYKCTNFYDPSDEGGLLWNDPDVGVLWPLNGNIPILSEKDKMNQLFHFISKD